MNILPRLCQLYTEMTTHCAMIYTLKASLALIVSLNQHLLPGRQLRLHYQSLYTSLPQPVILLKKYVCAIYYFKLIAT